jgi:predicted DNA-binding protein
MTLMVRDIHFVVGTQGKPTAVLIDIATWEQIVQALEEVEDMELAKEALRAIDAAEGDLDKAGLLSWESVKADLERMDDTKA